MLIQREETGVAGLRGFSNPSFFPDYEDFAPGLIEK